MDPDSINHLARMRVGLGATLLAAGFGLGPVLSFLAWPFRHALKLAGWVLLAILAGALFQQLRQPQPDLKQVAGLTALLLISGLVAQHGSDLLPRLKKLGPLELFEEKASGLLAALDSEEIGKLNLNRLRGAFSFDRKGTQQPSLDAEERLAYQQADLFISMMEWNGIDLSKDGGPRARRYLDLLWWVICSAYTEKDFPRALSRLSLCRKFNRDLEQVDFSAGLIHFAWSQALQEDEAKSHHLERAFHYFCSVLAVRKGSHRAYAFLAAVCDARQDYGLALRYNARALRIRPQLSSARYNRACAFAKLGRLAASIKCLKKIQASDEGVENVLEFLRVDPDLRVLRDHVSYGAELRRLYLDLGGPEHEWDPPSAGR